MQIGSVGVHATSRLRAVQAGQASSSGRAKDEAGGAGAAAAGPLSGSGGLLSFMSGQAAIRDKDAGLVSDQSLRAWARGLNDTDRALVESVTGRTIAEDGGFLDQDGKAASLTPSETAIVAALSLMRSEQSPAETKQPVTGEQYDALCNRAQVALFQAGTLFDPAVRQAGHDFLSGAAPVAEPVEDDTSLPIATRHHVEDLVNDPAYAMGAVEQFAKRPLGMMVKLPVPENGKEGWVDPEVVQASFDRWKGYYETVNAVHAKAATLFEQGKAAGKTGAEIYADILRDQLAQPDDYWQARDPDNLGGVSRDQVAAELRALEAAIARRPG